MAGARLGDQRMFLMAFLMDRFIGAVEGFQRLGGSGQDHRRLLIGEEPRFLPAQSVGHQVDDGAMP